MALKRLLGGKFFSYLSCGLVFVHGVLFYLYFLYGKTPGVGHFANEPLIVQAIVLLDLPAGLLSGLLLYPFYNETLSIGIETDPNSAQLTYYWVSTYLWFGIASFQWYFVGILLHKPIKRFRK